MGYNAYELSENDLENLRAVFEPSFPDFIGHHITFQFGVPDGTAMPTSNLEFKVTGYVKGEDIEALLVDIRDTLTGKQVTRPDGKQLHITWSLDRSTGRKPFHSNDLINDSKPIRFENGVKIFPTPKWIK